MKYFLHLLSVLLAISVVGCQTAAPVCPAKADSLASPRVWPTVILSEPGLQSSPTPVWLEINGKPVSISKVVDGPLCNDTWQGIVYVGCNVQVHPWVNQPLFLQGCALAIKPGTTVYVAAHNNAAFYNGCSCHTGEAP